MGRQGEGGGLKILKNEETSFMDDPLIKQHNNTFNICQDILRSANLLDKWCLDDSQLHITEVSGGTHLATISGFHDHLHIEQTHINPNQLINICLI